jgi:mRNA-degrading endonuclease RelE of RelBE toxin-antitoxin system
MKEIAFTPAALRQWTKLAPATRERIKGKLDVFASTGAGDIKRLKGQDGCRLRRLAGDLYRWCDRRCGGGRASQGRLRLGRCSMTVRFKKTDKGEVAILPRKEYEALVAKANEAAEDAGTARLVARARKEIAAGMPLIPMAVADRIARGENPIRVIREWKDITQLHLSFKTNIGQGHISDMETGRRKGTTAALKKIARVLDVPIDVLV